jgi:tetratricopeptide (TPR) repeat protein
VGLARTLRLEVVPQASIETLPLGPQEYFVLSRVEGRATVAEIIVASGLGATAAEQILERLLQLGALRIDDAAAVTPAMGPVRQRQSTQELRTQAQDRRRRVLQQQLAAGRRPASPETQPIGAEAAPARGPQPEPTPGFLDDEPAPPPAMIEPVPFDDPRLDPALGLPLDEQRQLLALEDRLDSIDPFALLGLPPTNDLKVIRDGFRDASRRLHPDAHHGRELGRFRTLLGTLFARAKAAHAALQRDEVREPLVAAVEAERAERRRHREAQDTARRAAEAAAEAVRQRRELEAAAERRAARTAQRAERERDRLVAAVKTKIAAYLQDASDAEAMENHARAANNYRLALQLDPDDAEIRERWETARIVARRRRAKEAFARACTLVEVGHGAEAVSSFLEAADADPTLEHLAHAADAVRDQDPVRARNLAMAALRLLGEEERAVNPLRPSLVADLRLMIGRAFLAAGQTQSAIEQAKLVQRLRPGDPQARALLNSAKVT